VENKKLPEYVEITLGEAAKSDTFFKSYDTTSAENKLKSVFWDSLPTFEAMIFKDGLQGYNPPSPLIMHPHLQAVFDLLPVKCPSIYIAGGAAVDVMNADDIDIWFPMRGQQMAMDFINSVKLPKQTIFDGFAADEPGPVGPNEYNVAVDSIPIFKVLADIYLPEQQKMLQVICYDKLNIYDLLYSFDISSHKRAINYRGSTVGSGSTVKTPKILQVHKKTLSRYVKICKRYHHDINVHYLQDFFPFDQITAEIAQLGS